MAGRGTSRLDTTSSSSPARPQESRSAPPGHVTAVRSEEGRHCQLTASCRAPGGGAGQGAACGSRLEAVTRRLQRCWPWHSASTLRMGDTAEPEQLVRPAPAPAPAPAAPYCTDRMEICNTGSALHKLHSKQLSSSLL